MSGRVYETYTPNLDEIDEGKHVARTRHMREKLVSNVRTFRKTPAENAPGIRVCSSEFLNHVTRKEPGLID